MPLTADGYEQATERELYDQLASTFRAETSDEVPVRDYTNVAPDTSTPTLVEATLLTQARLLANNQEESLQKLYRAGYIEAAVGQALTRRCRDIGIERRPAVPATGVIEFTRDSAATRDYVIPSGTIVQTEGTDPVRFETLTAATIAQGETAAEATIEAVQGGEQANVGPGAITVMPSPPAGVQGVTNPVATGDPGATDTRGGALVPGRDREADDALRERALQSTAIGGAGTPQSIATALRDTEDVLSVRLYENTADCAQDGLPATSGEVVVQGATDTEVAETIHATAPFTGELASGVNATGVSVDIESEALDQTRTIRFSRPTETQLRLTLDLRIDATYAGDDAIRDRLVGVVGGIDTAGGAVVGEASIGRPVFVQTLEDAVVGDETGVVGVASLTADTNGDGSDDTEQQDGLAAIPVTVGSVLTLAASDVTIQTTQL